MCGFTRIHRISDTACTRLSPGINTNAPKDCWGKKGKKLIANTGILELNDHEEFVGYLVDKCPENIQNGTCMAILITFVFSYNI